jgi:hypothetical protein
MIDREDVLWDPGTCMHLADWGSLAPRDPDAFIKSFPKAKRRRRPTIRQIEKETGRVVTAVTVAPDGSRSYALGEKADAPATFNEWDQDLGTHPPQIRQ